jgi:hypothetical protein
MAEKQRQHPQIAEDKSAPEGDRAPASVGGVERPRNEKQPETAAQSAAENGLEKEPAGLTRHLTLILRQLQRALFERRRGVMPDTWRKENHGDRNLSRAFKPKRLGDTNWTEGTDDNGYDELRDV